MGDHILRLPQVKAIIRLSESTIYELIAKDQFPKQIKLSKRSSGWVESEVQKWIEEKIRQRKEEEEKIKKMIKEQEVA